MEKDFLDYEYKIDLNEKHLEHYHDLYEKTLSKISFISIVYSVLAIYSGQLIQFAVTSFSTNIIFAVGVIIYFAVVLASIIYTVRFLMPVGISHLHSPKYYYEDIRKQYEQKGKGKNPAVLNKYIQATYLNEIEKAVDNNFEAFRKKRRLFYLAFTLSLTALLPYTVCIGIYLSNQEKNNPKKVEIVNLDSLHSKLDSQHLQK